MSLPREPPLQLWHFQLTVPGLCFTSIPQSLSSQTVLSTLRPAPLQPLLLLTSLFPPHSLTCILSFYGWLSVIFFLLHTSTLSATSPFSPQITNTIVFEDSCLFCQSSEPTRRGSELTLGAALCVLYPNCQNRLSLSQLHDENYVIFFAGLNLPPLLVTTYQEKVSPPFWIINNYLIGQKFVGVFVYAESARTLRFNSIIWLLNLEDDIYIESNGQQLMNGDQTDVYGGIGQKPWSFNWDRFVVKITANIFFSFEY